jgi:hypothetical protein
MSTDRRRWYHITLTAYGAWLYGDARGFRTRHHREHVEGDYKHRPSLGKYAAKEQLSRKALKQTAVVLPPARRELVGHALQRAFTRQGSWVLVMAVCGQHAHLLVKLPRGKARLLSGRAKRMATIALRSIGWKGRVWGVRSRAVPIRDRAHQENSYHYIVAHEQEGAWVGIWKDDPTRESN